MNDESDKFIKMMGEAVDEHKIKFAKQAVAQAYKIALDKVGREKARQYKTSFALTIPVHNRIMGSSIRITIPTLDAIILCLAMVPVECGMDIHGRQAYREFVEKLYAVREVMIEDRDADIKAQTNL